MKNLIKRVIPQRLLDFIRNALGDYYLRSYSQEGEDMILHRIFAGQRRGFYVDVGAHHPRRFSNTYFFYRRGWSGINIEPNPDAFRLFRSVRTRDINLQLGISDTAGRIPYYQFDEPALNTFDGEMANSRLAKTNYKLKTTREVAVERLETILSGHLPTGVQIDFLSIDVEGLDFAVLKSNNWNRFRPKCVLVESLNVTLEKVMQSEIFDFMKRQQYVLFAKTFNTLIFLSDAPNEQSRLSCN